MATQERSQVFDRVRDHAFQQLEWQKRQTTNLYLSTHVFETGMKIGPAREKIVADRPTVLVFADDNPQANFGHDCRYLLYNAENGDFLREKMAQFPPFDPEKPGMLQPFHQPVQQIATPVYHFRRWPWRCPIVVPDGHRYAILYSGMSNKRHLNDMEFLYRTLVDRYAFDPANIYALSYDGTLNTQDGVQTNWPGDGSAYRIHITGSGTRAEFEAAVDALKGRIKTRDLLLIHTNNHGGYDGTPGTANLCTYPTWNGYYANDFAAKLAQLPHFRKLIVMMEQCHAGGFNGPIIANSPAHDTSVASAATEPNSSYVTADGNWDPFAMDWIAAQAGHDRFGHSLAFNPDGNGNGIIEAEEAFDYANFVRDPRDTPNFSENSEVGGDISLGQEYSIYWLWWCWILSEVLEEYYLKLPPEEYFARLRKVQPELTTMAAALNESALAQRKETLDKVQAVIKKGFGR